MLSKNLEISLPKTSEKIEYASFWRRFAAVLIDSLLLMLCAFSIMGVIFIFENPFKEGHFALGPASRLAKILINYACYPFYFAVMESSRWQASIGKRLMKIKIVDFQNHTISFGKSFARYMANYLSLLLVGIGYLIFPFTEKKQFLHDKLCKTLVIKR